MYSNPKARLFLDMDEVLTDFCGQAKSWGYEKHIEPGKFCGDPELWNIINKDPYYFAASMCWKEGAKKLYTMLMQTPHPVIPITSYASEEWKKGRLFWIECNLPLCETPITLPLGESKANHCAGKTDILIDDIWENVREWDAKGGSAVIWDWKRPEESHMLLDITLEKLGLEVTKK